MEPDMVDVLERPFTSPETSDDGPALAVLGDRLFIAWVGSGNKHLNIMPSIDLPDGRVGFDRNAKVIIQQGESMEVNSLGGPALISSGGELLLAWTHDGGGIVGPGSAQSLFGITFNVRLERTGFVSSLEDTSDAGPALTHFHGGNGVNIAWKGSGNNNLNVMQKRPVQVNGFVTAFDGATKSTSNETSPFRPALCSGQFGNFTIYIAWTGEGDGRLNFMSFIASNPFEPVPPTDFDSATKVTINEHSPSAPAIEALEKGLYLSWRGHDNRINVLGKNLQSEVVRKQPPSGQTTEHHPALAAYRGRLFVAWTGEDDKLSVAQMLPMFH